MSNQPEEGESSTPLSTSKTKTPSKTGFYASLLAKGNSNTPKPSFLDDTSKTVNATPAVESRTQAKNSTPITSLYSIPSATPITSLSTTFNSIKRKRPNEIVTKPPFNVSEFVSAKPHLPKFGTSLNLGSLSSQSKFYSGRTMFGGSSSLREDSAKRRKISPVSIGARTNITSVTAKPYSRNDDRRTLTSKTAESILKTLNKICTPSLNTTERSKPSYSKFSTNFSSLSKQLREKRKSEASSISSPPVSSLNHLKTAKLDSIVNPNPITNQNTPNETTTNELSTNKIDTIKPSFTITQKIDSIASETDSKPALEPIESKSAPDIKEVPILTNAKPVTKIETQTLPVPHEVLSTTNNKSLKMKRQLTRDHYSIGKKEEEPVNPLPEVTPIQPLIIKELPKFDLKVNPASATMFTPIPKPSKPLLTSKCDDVLKTKSENVNGKYSFSTPKTVNDKSFDCDDSLKKYSFISPIAVSVKTDSEESSNKDLSEKKTEIAEPKKVEETKVDIAEKPKTIVPAFGLKLPQKAEGSWDCPTCMINNKADCLKCAACTEPKPGSKVSATSNFSFGTSAAPTNSGFSFGKLSETKANPEANSFSIASSKAAAAAVNDTSEATDTKSKPTEDAKPNPFAKFNQTQDTWSCPTCMISNASDVLKCAACTEPKPGIKTESTSIKPAFSFGSTNSSTVTGGFSFGSDSGKATNGFSFGAAASSATSSSGFSFGSSTSSSGFSFGKSTEASAATKPVESDLKSSETVTTKVDSESDKPSPGFGAAVSNSASFGTVAATENPFLKLQKNEGGIESKPEIKEAATPEPSKPESLGFSKISSGTNPLSNLQKAEEGSWDCPTCMITNKPDCLKCVACTEPKPGAPPAPAPANTGFSFGKTAAQSANGNGGFSFGKPVAESNGSGGFSFGKPANESNGNGGFSFGKPVSESNGSATFTFGKPIEEAKADTGFSFSKPTVEANGFSFKPPVAETPLKTIEPAVSSTFAPPAAVEPPKLSFGTATSGFTFGQPPTANGLSNSAGFSFGSTVAAEPAKEEPPIKVTNLFGNQDVNKVFNGGDKPASTGFNFGGASQTNIFAPKVNGDTATAPAPAQTLNSTPQFNFSAKPSFTIGASEVKPAEPPAAKFSFNPASMSTPNFNFGSVTSATTLFGNSNPNGQFSFANNNNLVNGTNNDPAKVNLFASPAPTANLFNIGGGGSTANTQSSMGNERRKIKRAHRRLQVKK